MAASPAMMTIDQMTAIIMKRAAGLEAAPMSDADLKKAVLDAVPGADSVHLLLPNLHFIPANPPGGTPCADDVSVATATKEHNKQRGWRTAVRFCVLVCGRPCECVYVGCFPPLLSLLQLLPPSFFLSFLWRL